MRVLCERSRLERLGRKLVHTSIQKRDAHAGHRGSLVGGSPWVPDDRTQPNAHSPFGSKNPPESEHRAKTPDALAKRIMSLRGRDAHVHRMNVEVTHCALEMLDSAMPERGAACSVGWCNSDRKSDRRGEVLECLHSPRRWTFRFRTESETPQLNTENDSDKMYIAVGGF